MDLRLDLGLIKVLKKQMMPLFVFVFVFVFVMAGLAAVIGIETMITSRDQHDRYNVLFVGTSMVYRAIDPVVLQKVAAADGCDFVLSILVSPSFA